MRYDANKPFEYTKITRRKFQRLDIKLIDGEFDNPVQERLLYPNDVVDMYGAIKDKSQETLVVMYLDNELRPITEAILSVGNNHQTLTNPRDMWGLGFVLKADNYIVVHNHPTGDPTPSEADKFVMSDLAKANHLGFNADIGMKLLDFVIIGKDAHFSMLENISEDAEPSYESHGAI